MRRLVDRVAYWLATWFGCGLVPRAPGTAGSIGAIPLYLALRSQGAMAVAVGAVVATFVGVWAATAVARSTGLKDPQIVVIDEVAGMLVTMSPAAVLATPPGMPMWPSLLAGFVLFRICDQFKPWPARWAERSLPLGWGIVLDDVFAGVWAAIGVYALRRAAII